MARKPKYCRHKATNRAYVTLNGKEEYLGEYDSSDSHERYRELIARWELGNASDSQLTLLGLAARFMAHAEKHYRRRVKDGTSADCFKLTGEHSNFRDALRGLCTKYGHLRVRQFTAMQLQEHQSSLVKQSKLCRNTINARIRRIRHVFKWAIPIGLVAPETLGGLQCVLGLDAGRTEARETAPVGPVPELDIHAVRPFVSRQVYGLLQLMRHTGARPGEATIIRWCEIDAEADVWIYRPFRHKNEHRGKSRLIAVGPQSQQVLNEFGGSDTDYIFRPQESVDEYATTHYRRGAKGRKVGAHYSVQSLRTAVKTACRKAGVDHWTPNQLRHNAGTNMRAKAGVDVAQIALGHSSVTTTERYAEQNISAAVDYALKFG